jgi:16S rRNA G1207 methylase RsmC
VAAASTRYQTPFGDFRLRRYPARREEPLQAWCAADTLLLEQIHRLGLPGREVLVANDEHGALSVVLQARALWTDSALAAVALQRNLAANQGEPIPVSWSTANPPGTPQLVALRVPKQLPFLEYQLNLLGSVLPVGSLVLAAGMDKHLAPRVPDLLEQFIGPTERQPGARKARLFCARRDQRNSPPAAASAGYFCLELGSELTALPNVFSRDRLDQGSRLLLAQLGLLAPARKVADLACGNGVLGLAALQAGLASELVFCDESAMALESARGNAGRLLPGIGDIINYHHGDGLLDYSGSPADLILCNPPFHLNHAVDEYAGRRLLTQCARHLPADGRLCLVANRHLNYLPTLKRHFRRVEKMAQDNKFQVWLAHRT